MIRTSDRMRILIHEAERWAGIKEIGGDNRGQIVEMFQKAVDGKASGEPWCLGFVQFCVKQADRVADVIADQCTPRNNLFQTEHCLTLWWNTPLEQRIEAQPGAIVIWKFGSTNGGHAGIVTAVNGDGSIQTIEGNTGDGKGIVREGDGVYTRKRSAQGTEEMRVMGFISAWPMEEKK
jgi:hypothetical protein